MPVDNKADQTKANRPIALKKKIEIYSGSTDQDLNFRLDRVAGHYFMFHRGEKKALHTFFLVALVKNITTVHSLWSGTQGAMTEKNCDFS